LAVVNGSVSAYPVQLSYFRIARYSDTISPARMVTTEIMWVHYRRYCWSPTAPS